MSEPTYTRDPELPSMAVRALQVLRQVMNKSDPAAARKLVRAFSELLGSRHPEIVKTQRAIDKAFPGEEDMDDKDDDEP